MKGVYITHRGEYEKDDVTYSEGNMTHLLHGEKDFEATVDIMPKGIVGYEHSVHSNSFEFNYLLRGSIELRDGDDKVILGPGDSYSHHTLNHNFMFRVLENAEVLSINTAPCFDDHEEEQNRLYGVLEQLQKVDGDTMQHCTRVTRLSMGIAYYMDIDADVLPDLFEAASFHDVGKAKIPQSILLKPGKLNNEEFEIMKKHSLYTYEMIKDCYSEKIARIAFEHHEKLDGTGYPQKLKADQISMPARIICVADAYDAMTVTRPYRQAMSQQDALAELYRYCDTQFDRSVVAALEEYLINNK